MRPGADSDWISDDDPEDKARPGGRLQARPGGATPGRPVRGLLRSARARPPGRRTRRRASLSPLRRPTDSDSGPARTVTDCAAAVPYRLVLRLLASDAAAGIRRADPSHWHGGGSLAGRAAADPGRQAPPGLRLM